MENSSRNRVQIVSVNGFQVAGFEGIPRADGGDTDTGVQEFWQKDSVNAGCIEAIRIVTTLEKALVGRQDQFQARGNLSAKILQIKRGFIQFVKEQSFSAKPLGEGTRVDGQSFFDDNNVIAQSFQLRKDMGTDHQRGPAPPGGEEFAGGGGFTWVETVEGFIEQHEFGLPEEGLCDHDPPAHAVGKSTGWRIETVLEMDVSDGVANSRFHLRGWNALEKGIEAKEFMDRGLGRELGILGEEGQFSGTFSWLEGALFQNVDPSAVATQNSGREGEGGRFSGSVASDQAADGTGGNRKGEMVQGATGAVILDHLIKLEGRFHRSLLAKRA